MFRCIQFVAFAFLLLSGCVQHYTDPCTVEQTENETVISCPDGATATVTNGADGSGCSVLDDGETVIICPDGTKAAVHDGQDGADGADGSDAVATHITEVINCGGTSDSFWFSYSVVLFSTGDVWSSGQIRTSSIGVSGSSFYPSEQTKSETAPVYMTLDEYASDSYGWWEIGLDRTTLVLTITYHDSDAPDGLIIWTFQPDQCISNSYT